MQATSARHYGEKDARLEYLSWRVWFMKRNRALAKADAQQRAAAGIVDDVSRHHADDETSDEEPMLPATSTGSKGVSFKLPRKEPSLQKVKEGEKYVDEGMRPPSILTKPPHKDPSLDFLAQEYVTSPPPPDSDKDLFEGRVDGLYLVLISLHGLVRGERMELGKDPDTGGQVKYVVELARALAQHPAVFRVDLLTRLIQDPAVDPTYGEPEEVLWKAPDDHGMGGAYIVRLPCGPPKTYLRKEKLWPHIREFADRGVANTKHTLVALGEAGTPCELYAVHGHYADAGEVAALMSSTLGVDMVMTGHSLGRNKLEHLLGTMSKKEIEENYAISRRIEAEERALETATMVLTSTQQEIDEQWGLYDGYDVKLERVLRTRRRVGRTMPLINVIPPGLDFSALKVDLPKDPSLAKGPPPKHAFFSQQSTASSNPTSPQAAIEPPTSPEKPLDSSPSDAASADEDGKEKSVARTSTAQGLFPFINEEPHIWQEIFRFLRNPRKPAILAMSRPDAKKNITTLVKAFGENPTLRELANLVLIMGNRENIDGMAPGSQKILTQVMKLIDSHDLYGSVAYPKKHEQKDISDIYLLPYATRGIFTNVALQEPFGLTVIEAAAHGVPTVATKNGGPVDIMATLHHGLLVDPTNSRQIGDALLKILTNPEVWDEMSHNGVANIMAYSWFSHCKKYLEALEMEKRFIKTQKRFQSRLSGNWDASTLKLDELVGSPTTTDSDMNRLASMPAGRSPKGVRRVPSNSQVVHASDDAGLTGHSSEDHSHGQPVSDKRKRFTAVALDGSFRVSAVAPLLNKLIKMRSDAGASDLGIGVVSMLGFSGTRKALEGAGVPVQELDWMVCNGGADIWQLLQSRDGKDPTWSSDEHWDAHITFRWDRDPLARAVTKLVSNDKKETLASAPTLQKALALMTDARQEHHVHPHHIMLPLDAEAKSILDMGPRATGKDAVATVVVDKMRRRMRQNGYHAHITLQMVVEDEQVVATVHITPMRASRALALRYLATKFGADMENIVLVAVAPSLEKTGEVTKVTAYTSDLIELVSGVSPVYIIGAAADEQKAEGRAAKHDSYALDKISIRVSPKVFGARIRCLPDDSALASALEDIVAGRVAGGYEGNKPGGAHDDDE
ncbi:hypothetical protein WJX75_009336 [Coccomyxa subellipsoidea]|uniref:sucrose-phosphate synthase n=1 Tax=Coccomyxa subellipsoidea TaxID=248742 RepID=A0ABR2Z4H2_9CHLO